MKFKRMKRRTFLKAAGCGASTISVGVPILDAMLDGNGHLVTPGYAQPSGQPLCYMSLCFPNGVGIDKDYDDWHPADAGPNYTITPALRPLEHLRDDFIVLSGTQKGIYHDNDGHSKITFSTGYPTQTRNGVRGAGGPSFEYLLGQHLGASSPIPFQPIGLDATNRDGMGPAMFSSPTDVIELVYQSQSVFNLFFGNTTSGGDSGSVPVDPLAAPRQSILDYVLDDITRLQNEVGAADRARLDQHFDSVRQLERRLAPPPVSVGSCSSPGSVNTTVPNEGLTNERLRYLLELQVKAFECGVTRVGFFMFGHMYRQFTWNPAIGEIFGRGYDEGHHAASHNNQEKLTLCTADQNEQFAYLLELMKNAQWGDTNLLHNSIVFMSSEISAEHLAPNMPILVAGNAGGQLQTGRAVQLSSRPYYSRVFHNFLELLSLESVAFGDPRFVGEGPIDGWV